MPTLKAEFSGGNDNGDTVHSLPATKAAVEEGVLNPMLSAAPHRLQPLMNEGRAPAHAAAYNALLEKIQKEKAEEAAALGEEGGGGDEGSNSGNKQEHTVILFNISDDPNKYVNSIDKLKNDIIDKLSQNTQISKNEIGYGISVALEPTTGLVSQRNPQYIGITLDLTHLELKTGKKPKEIFEICRNRYILFNQ